MIRDTASLCLLSTRHNSIFQKNPSFLLLAVVPNDTGRKASAVAMEPDIQLSKFFLDDQ